MVRDEMGFDMYKLISLLMCSALIACGSGGGGEPDAAPEPYVSVPLADLAAGTELHVRGNHTGWWRNRTNPSGSNVANLTGPKLQRFDTTGNPGEYVAVFRRNETQTDNGTIPPFNFGRATFIMPPPGGTVEGITDENYEFSIVRNADNTGLIFTLAGIFHIYTNPLDPDDPDFDPGRQAHGGYVAGSYTPENALPTSGSFNYSGEFIGYSSAVQDVTGTFTMTASFAPVVGGPEVVGTITGLSGGISDLTIEAELNPIDSSYSGIVTGTGTGDDFTPGADGKVDGGFYGPSGEETGATIRIDEGGHYLTGAFAGDQNP